MTDDKPVETVSLLSLCASLRWFTAELLLSLTDLDPSELDALLVSERVLALDDPAGAYALRPELQAAVMHDLHSAQPLVELDLHTRAFSYFVQQIVESSSREQRLAAEEECCYHLHKLFFGLLPRMEWTTITQHVGAVRALNPCQPQHLQQLALYEGYVAVRTQDYERGEPILTELLDAAELEPDVRMHALNALGQMHRNRTHYDRALTIFQQLQQFAQDSGNEVFKGLAWLNMSSIYNELEYHDRALELAERSLPIFQQHDEPVREAYALYCIGLNAMYLGRWQVAQQYFDLAIRRFQELSMTAGLMTLYWSQGYLHHMLGHEADSEAFYRRALELAESPEYDDPLVAMDTYLYLGFLYATQAHSDRALTHYAQALELANRLRYEHRACLIAYQRGNVLRAQGLRREALAAYADAIECIEALRGGAEGQDVKIGLIGTTQHVYEAMVLLCLELDRPADAFAYAERARSRAFLDMLHTKAPELYAAADQPVATLAEVQAALPPDTLLIEYFTTGVVPTGERLLTKLPPENERLRRQLLPPARIVLFAITHDSFAVYPVAAELDPNQLQPSADDPAPGRRWLRERALVALYERLIAPVEDLLEGRALLYLIPHGPLHYLPFSALRSASGVHLLAADRPALAFAPSATVLLRNCLGRPRSQATQTLALGYNDRGADLRYAESEARLVARLMHGQAWTGSAAKTQQLLAAGPHLRWLHIAGHAAYNPHSPLDSALHLGAGDTLSARTIVERLELNAELVTLSVSTRGLNAVVPGDELLQHALRYAGTPTVVGTLWDAYDFVALLIMERFYTSLIIGQPPAYALRDAQVAIREMTLRDVAAAVQRWAADDREQHVFNAFPPIDDEQYAIRPYADPEYWAPFMLTGRS